eukprot:COSAG02_NODE_63236_length_263_cov_1.573171_1_plen_27_part_10
MLLPLLLVEDDPPRPRPSTGAHAPAAS